MMPHERDADTVRYFAINEMIGKAKEIGAMKTDPNLMEFTRICGGQ